MANRTPAKATIQGLRTVLSGHFDELETALRRLRENNLLPRGKPGRGGCGSAPITPQHAALVLLGLASSAWSTLAESPSEARRIGDLRLDGRGGSGPKLLDVLSGELIAIAHDVPGAVQHYAPSAWTVSQHRVHQRQLGLTFGDGAAGHGGVERSTTVRPELINDVAALFRPVEGQA